MSGINCQTEAFEIPVKRKTGGIVENMGNHNKRDSVAERDAIVFGEFLKNLFCRCSHRIIIIYNEEVGLDVFKKRNSSRITCTVSQQSNGFADDIPCRIERNFMLLTIFEKFNSFFVVRIVRV